MDTIGKLNLKWALGYLGSSLHYVNENTLVYSTGNALTFIGSDATHRQSVPSQGNGVGPLAVCPQAKLIAYAEASLEPLIFIINYPQCELFLSLKGSAKLEYASLCFSADGMKCASLSGVPDFLLTVWDTDSGSVVHEVSIGSCALGASISFNPLNWKQLCLVGPKKISVLSVECCDTQVMISSIETNLPDKTTPVGVLVQPGKQSTHATHRQSIVEQSRHRAAGELVIPDMTKAFYKESYVDKIKKRVPVSPSSHCWTPHASIYIGCDGGQLLLVDFESGAVKVLSNPLPPELDDDDSKKNLSQDGSSVSQPPRTGHAVLTAGSIQCLVLSRRGLFAGGKDGSMYCFEQSSELKILDSCKFDHPISSIAWSMDYNNLVVGNQQGSIYKIDPFDLSSKPEVLFEHNSSAFIGIDVPLTDSSHCMTCCSDGTVQVWSTADGSVTGTLHLNRKCSSFACPKSSSMAVVGTVDGYLCGVSLVDLQNPALVMKERLYKAPLKIIRYDQTGQFLITATANGPILICSAKPSEKLAVLAHTAVEGEIEDVSIAYLGKDKQPATKVAVLSKQHSLITVFFLPDTLTPKNGAPDSVFADSTCLLADDAVMKQQILLSEPATNLVLTSSNTVYITLIDSKQLCKLQLPNSDEKIAEVEVTKQGTLYDFDGLPAKKLALSYHLKWLATIASDGKITLRLVETPERAIQCTPHHYRLGGVSDATLTTDCQSLLSIGDSGTALSCYQWELSSIGKTKLAVIAEFVHSRTMQLRPTIESEDNYLSTVHSIRHEVKDRVDGTTDEGHLSSTNLVSPRTQDGAKTEECDDTQTWLQLATEKAHRAEDEKYADMKAELRQKINDLRAKVMSMISLNEEVPDIEKLEKQEFILDTEEHERLKVEENDQISNVHEEAELANLEKQYLRDIIKQQCWDAMAVKGKAVKAFQGRLEVSNYAMRKCSSEEVKELERVTTLRKCEIAEKKTRDEVSGSMKLVTRGTAEDFDEMFADDQSSNDVATDTAALLGSRGDKYGGASALLYDQFELVSPVTKKHQIILLQDCVVRIKETFNKEFDEVLRLKEAEIGRILEKNTRIHKISNDLKMDEHLVVPSLDSFEQPQRLLIVQEDEITVEKYVSPEEKKRLEETAKIEEERRLKEKGDNWRERALDMMMGGRLEANAEEDLFKDLPQPEFMSKDPTELTEEEIRMAREFEKKEIAFLEERDKLKKALEAEMKKLQEGIQLAMATFDERVMKLFQHKVKTELVVQQEELKILRLTMSLLVEEEVKMKEKMLENVLSMKKAAKMKLGGVLVQTKRLVDECREQYDQIVQEDKELDRAFKRDFSDCDPYVDQLYRLFRRRPRVQKLKGAASVTEAAIDPKTANPFTPRPSSGSLTHGTGLVSKPSFELMAELDSPSYMPEGVESVQWDRLVAARHRKVESEQKVKAAALKLADMNAFLRKRQKEDDQLQEEIQEAFRDLNQLHEDKSLFDMNPQIQFLLRQGQVEVDAGDYVPNFSDSVLIHRSVVEELNSQIKTLGEMKLANMSECKNIKRGIRMLEWELRRLLMEADDLAVKAKDIQMLRVTKELQERLMEENVQGKDQHAIETLEMTFDLNQKTQKRRIRLKQKNLTTLQDEIDRKAQENAELSRQILNAQVSVTEKMNVEDLAGMLPSEAEAEARMKQVITRRRLVELAKQQAEQVTVLRAEVEKLRMRTFPALVQVEN